MQGNYTTGREALEAFGKAVLELPGSFGSFSEKVIGLSYDRNLEQAKELFKTLKSNKLNTSLEILDMDKGDPVNRFHLRAGTKGGDEIIIEMLPDRHCMLKELGY